MPGASPHCDVLQDNVPFAFVGDRAAQVTNYFWSSGLPAPWLQMAQLPLTSPAVF